MSTVNPRLERYATKLHFLLEEGNTLISTSVERGQGRNTKVRYILDRKSVYSWHTRTENIIKMLCGENSTHYTHFKAVKRNEICYTFRVEEITAIIEATIRDMEEGLLSSHEMLFAGVFFDSVLKEAKYLLEKKFKDPTAILGRVIIEDLLRRLAKEEGLDSTEKASKLNENLRKCGRFTQPTWRYVSGLLDIGNLAAHGKFNEYTEADVERMIQYIEDFLAKELVL